MRYGVVRYNGHFGVWDAFRKRVTKEGDGRFCTIEARRLNDERRPPTPIEVERRREEMLAAFDRRHQRCLRCGLVYECTCPGGKS
jgi:hypothetical protein